MKLIREVGANMKTKKISGGNEFYGGSKSEVMCLKVDVNREAI
jgi:hypothetical protein